MSGLPSTVRPMTERVRLTPQEWLRLRGLTSREIDVALLVGRGFLLQTAADHLSISRGTTKALLARAREKLGCRTARELETLLLREGAVQPADTLDPRELR